MLLRRLALIRLHVVQCFDQVLKVDPVRSIGIDVAVAGGDEADLLAKIIAVEEKLDVWSKKAGEEVGKGGFSCRGRTGDA